MKGNNEMHLNQATMREAVQYWFTNVLFASGQAPAVEEVSENKCGGDFRVKCSERQP